MTQRPAGPTTDKRRRPVHAPPRWFAHAFWHAHRWAVRVSRGRIGLWRPGAKRWGTLALTTTGRHSGRPREVLLGYFEDGDDLVTLAMNGWGAPEPAWWLNLQARPDAVALTRDGLVRVHARAAEGAERDRLWSRWAENDDRLDEYAALRPRPTAVVVLESRGQV